MRGPDGCVQLLKYFVQSKVFFQQYPPKMRLAEMKFDYTTASRWELSVLPVENCLPSVVLVKSLGADQPSVGAGTRCLEVSPAKFPPGGIAPLFTSRYSPGPLGASEVISPSTVFYFNNFLSSCRKNTAVVANACGSLRQKKF